MFKLVVLTSVLALAAAKPSVISPLGLAGLGVAAPWAAPLVAPVAAPIAVAAPLIGHAPNYRGPLSLAPGQPANILAVDGRPLDTLSVNLDRAAHLTARAVDAARWHLLKKRSAPLLASPLALGHAAPLIAPAALALSAAHLGPIAPLGLAHAPLAHLG